VGPEEEKWLEPALRPFRPPFPSQPTEPRCSLVEERITLKDLAVFFNGWGYRLDNFPKYIQSGPVENVTGKIQNGQSNSLISPLKLLETGDSLVLMKGRVGKAENLKTTALVDNRSGKSRGGQETSVDREMG